MKKKQSNTILLRSMTIFFVLLAGLFALLAGVKALRYLDSRQAVNLVSPSESQRANTTEVAQPPQTAAQPQSVPSSAALPNQAAPGEKVIYLTFDDGPTANTGKIMDALDRCGVKGTFFVVHSYDGCEKQIKEIYDRGHQIALHTYSHKYEIYRSQQTYFEDLGKISDLVYNATGYRSMLVRFPGGSSNTISRKYCSGIMTALTNELPRRGYAYFDWNADSMDASGKVVSAEKIVRNSTAYIGKLDQIILLMHDAKIKTTTADALPQIIETYTAAGYRFDVLSTQSFTAHHTVNN